MDSDGDGPMQAEGSWVTSFAKYEGATTSSAISFNDGASKLGININSILWRQNEQLIYKTTYDIHNDLCGHIFVNSKLYICC